MAETSNGGGASSSNEAASGVSGLSMSTPEGGITMPLLTSQFYQGRKRTVTMTLIGSSSSTMSLKTSRSCILII